MSLTSAITSALSGLQASSIQMQVASSNIANAQTAGYSTKTAHLTTSVLGDFGGVAIGSYTRSTNQALLDSYNTSTTQSSFYGTQSDYLQRVQTLLGSTTGNPPLSNALANFQSAWTQFSSAPESGSQRSAVIQAGQNLSLQIKTIANGITAIQQQVNSDISGTTGALNAQLSTVATYNAQIAEATAQGQPTGDLEDKRDQAINAVAAITNVKVLQRNSGQIALYTTGGQLLLDGGQPQTFSYTGNVILNGTGQDVTSALTGGSLQAQYNFVNGSATSTDPGTGVIGKLTAQLQALTTALTDASSGSPQTFANAYNAATTGSGELASGFFAINGTDPSTFVVNSNLLDGTSTIKQASATTVVAALSATRTFTASGLSATGTYTDLGTAILSNFQQAANTVKNQSLSATQQRDFYQQSLASATGVNVDNELVNLTTLQNSYAASAHVIATINAMMQALEGIMQ
jgi:flagellar hook-associated protein 1 FlgK